MTKPIAPCGTTAAYKVHRKRDEVPCRACMDAEAAYRASRPDRQGKHFVVPDLPNLPDALCRDVDPELWNATDPHTAAADTAAAKAVCAMCPERDACLDYAMRYPVAQLSGVWGGLTQSERRELRRQRAGEAA